MVEHGALNYKFIAVIGFYMQRARHRQFEGRLTAAELSMRYIVC